MLQQRMKRDPLEPRGFGVARIAESLGGRLKDAGEIADIVGRARRAHDAPQAVRRKRRELEEA